MKLPQAGAAVARLERLSVELTNRCGKACWFCYNRSSPEGATAWTADELVALVEDCASHGVKAVSFGGGEPLETEAIFELLARLRGTLFRSMTTNGLRLDDLLDRLVEAAPDKVHVSLHFPGHLREVERVARQVRALEARGVASGVNLLVMRTQREEARRAVELLGNEGIGNDRIVYLPMRGQQTPTADELGVVAGQAKFQSMSCLLACGASPRFCSIGWDRSVAWCSYTKARRTLAAPTFAALTGALDGLGLDFCGAADG